jgi:hypothetical protein
MEACRCSIVPTICHLTPRLLATVLGPLKKARDHYPSRPYRPRALAPRWQSGKWHSGFIARMTFHLLKDDWGGRRQLTRQIEKIFRCRTSTPGAGTHRSICSKVDGVSMALRSRCRQPKNYRSRTYTPKCRHASFHLLKDDGGGLTSRRQRNSTAAEKFSLQVLYPLSLLKPSERHCSSTTS